MVPAWYPGSTLRGNGGKPGRQPIGWSCSRKKSERFPSVPGKGREGGSQGIACKCEGPRKTNLRGIDSHHKRRYCKQVLCTGILSSTSALLHPLLYRFSLLQLRFPVQILIMRNQLIHTPRALTSRYIKWRSSVEDPKSLISIQYHESPSPSLQWPPCYYRHEGGVLREPQIHMRSPGRALIQISVKSCLLNHSRMQRISCRPSLLVVRVLIYHRGQAGDLSIFRLLRSCVHSDREWDCCEDNVKLNLLDSWSV